MINFLLIFKKIKFNMGTKLCLTNSDGNNIGPIIENNNNNGQNSNEANNKDNNENQNNGGSNCVGNDGNNEFKKQNFNEYIWVWIDPSVENKENQFFYDILFKNNNINCLKFDNVDEGYNYLIDEKNKIIFKEIIIIISLKLFNNFYLTMKENISNIKFSPTIIIFTRDEEICKNKLKMNNIYNCNNDLFDTRYIFTNPEQIQKFMAGEIPEDNDFTFDIIDYIDQLIIPNYYIYLLEDVNKPEIFYFNDFIKRKFLPEYNIEKLIGKNQDKIGNKIIQDLIKQI